MALIQVLALHKYGDRSEKGLTDEVHASPRSGSTWKEIAQQHPEFFRVNDAERLGVSLVARHVLPRGEEGKRELPPDFVSTLLQTAINLHDRQVERAHRWKTYMNVVIPGILVIVAALLGGYFTQKWTFDREMRIRDHEKRQIVYSELMGTRIVTEQLYISRSEAIILSDYHEFQWRKRGAQKDSIHLSEHIRWMRKSEDYIIEITRNNQKLFEKLGLVRILFPKSEDLNKKIERIYMWKGITVHPPKPEMNLNQLETWRVEAVKHLKNFVEREYGDPIDDLLSHLSKFLE
jgi:hypothetical protein